MSFFDDEKDMNQTEIKDYDLDIMALSGETKEMGWCKKEGGFIDINKLKSHNGWLRDLTKHKYQFEMFTFSEKVLHYVRVYDNGLSTLLEVL